MFKLIFGLVIKLLRTMLLLQSSYNNYVINLLKAKNNKSIFLTIIKCFIYSLPVAVVYALFMCFMRSIVHAFFVMGLNWFDNWYVFFCLQFPLVKNYMLLYSYALYNDPLFVLINPIEYKQLFCLFAIKIAASFFSGLFFVVWFSSSFNLFWKAILNLPSYGQLLVMILTSFLDLFFEDCLTLDSKSLLFFIIMTYLCLLLAILFVLILSIFFKNLFTDPEDYKEYLKLAKQLNDKKSE